MHIHCVVVIRIEHLENPTMFKLFLVYIVVRHAAGAYGGSHRCDGMAQELNYCTNECCGSCPDSCVDLLCLCGRGCCGKDGPCEFCGGETLTSQPTTPVYCYNNNDCQSGFCDRLIWKCSPFGFPTEHGSIDPTEGELFTPTDWEDELFTPTEDELFMPNEGVPTFTTHASPSFHLTTVKVVFIAVGCLFLFVPIVVIAFILDVKRRRAAISRRALVPGIASSIVRVPQPNSAQNHVPTSTEVAVQNPNHYPEISLGPSTLHREPPPPYTPHARPSTPPPPYEALVNSGAV